MQGRVGDGAIACSGRFESEGGVFGVDLGAVEDLDIVHDGGAGTRSCDTVEDLDCVASNNLSAPTFDVLCVNLDVSCEKEHLTSHVQAVVVRSGGRGLTPMVIAQRRV